MMTRRLAAPLFLAFLATSTVHSAVPSVSQLRSGTADGVEVTLNPATGVPRFISFRNGGGYLAEPAAATSKRQASAFMAQYASAFGIEDPADLSLQDVTTDVVGQTHMTYIQSYKGVPVYAGVLRLHLDSSGRVVTVNGTAVPDIDIDPTPYLDGEAAESIARAAVLKEKSASRLSAREQKAKLLVYRSGLARGVEGANHLAWEIEVANGSDVRFMVYVDAHSGAVLDSINMIHELSPTRQVYDVSFAASGLVWKEGDVYPTGNRVFDEIITTSGQTFDFFAKAFGRDAYDGKGSIMHSVNRDARLTCPNATWDGKSANFCNGTAVDDVIAHEWTHAYTQYTHNLIYLWQPGALNEAYSDIFGETIDLLNGEGDGHPSGLRQADRCSVFTDQQPKLTIESPAAIAKDYPAQGAQFGPALSATPLRGEIVLVDDNVAAPEGSRNDGCESFLTDVRGKIALIDRGLCNFTEKVKNAQERGAIGVIVANDQRRGEQIFVMAGEDSSLTIPSMFVGHSTGVSIKAQLNNRVTGSLRIGSSSADNNVRWLIGESSTAFGGAIRDMWNPGCFSQPKRVTDAMYFCSGGDNGGVHSNSAVPNHIYATLVDGGVLNGQTIAPIGLTRAAHIYFRAMSTYQVPASDFGDHADAIANSCTDLIGQNLNDLRTGLPSGEIITSANCATVAAAMTAAEMRSAPLCKFLPLLAKAPPALCPGETIFYESFENGLGAFTPSSMGVDPSWTKRDWVATADIPEGHHGSAAYATESASANCEVSDESGVIHLDSRPIAIPAGAANLLLSFRHYVATEFGWDGGNIKISVNGGEWILVPRTAFIYNRYTLKLLSDARENTNPLGGEDSFSGLDDGSLGGSWGESQVDLSKLAAPGDSIRLRFSLGTDRCVGHEGWYVDDVKITACGMITPRRRPIQRP
jgi:Zn-dependent metalloprotease